jgi:lysozyme
MLLFFFMVSTTMKEVDLKVSMNVPMASEIKKLEKKSLVSYIYIGKPKEKFQKAYGSEPRIQLNDAFADVKDIADYIESERQQKDEKEIPLMTTSLKVDEDTKMGIVSDVKQELRKVSRLKFVYVKITEGAATKDPWFERNVDSVRASGFLVGAYHFMTKSPAALQFENFRANYDIDRQDFLPVVDVEDDGTRGWSREEIQSCLKTFCTLFSNYYGRTPIIYCSESYYKDYLSPDFDNYLLWIASYGHEPTLPGAPHYDIWQKSRRGRVPGVWNWVDLNRMGAGHVVEDFKW